MQRDFDSPVPIWHGKVQCNIAAKASVLDRIMEGMRRIDEGPTPYLSSNPSRSRCALVGRRVGLDDDVGPLARQRSLTQGRTFRLVTSAVICARSGTCTPWSLFGRPSGQRSAQIRSRSSSR